MHVTHKVPHHKRMTHKPVQNSKGYTKIARTIMTGYIENEYISPSKGYVKIEPNVSQSSVLGVLGTPEIPLRVKM